eukprot:TRINITY_DN277_c0_g1_i1.p1 TRINITY_DN277_c0_g1~~TRINITY_DN277_c0_g1_i1.p1  ORF type:complete len:684 (+),score=232.76 TRINITY_DN277_c0_g1_i1:227-2278(+)
MEFASSYFLSNDDEEYEVFNDDILNSAKPKIDDVDEEGSASEEALSDDDDHEEMEEKEEKEEKAEVEKRLRRVKKADTNICAVNLGTLAEGNYETFTGDIVLCRGCSVSLTVNSKIEDVHQQQQWICEYCGFSNVLSLEPEEIPKTDTIDYLISRPPQGAQDNNNDILIFCIDISGSMSCTQEITGDVKIKKDDKLEKSLEQFVERHGERYADQYLPHERKNVSYVSRLQCVQAAVSSQIGELVKDHPKKRVAIVTFSNDVTVHMPGGRKHIISGERLYDWDYLSGVINQLELSIATPVESAAEELNKIVFSLEEGGATALGPALLVSTGLAGTARGSSVLLCTDGIANVGLGSLEDLTKDNVLDHPSAKFYDRVSQNALDKGVAVSIMTIKGTSSSLEFIAKVSADTHGINHIVDPLNLTKNFNFILSNSIIATEVVATMFLHKALKFRNELDSDKGTNQVRNVGNVTKETSVTFEYGLSDKKLLEGLTQIPFQIQIKYTKLDGSQCIRVLSKFEKVTSSREEAQKNINVTVVGLHSQQQSAKLASEGNYSKARMVQKANMRMVRRTLKDDTSEETKFKYGLWNKEAKRLNAAIKSKKIEEKEEGLNYDSADEDDFVERVEEEEEEKEKEEKQKEKQEKRLKRKQERITRRGRDDAVANVLYQAQNPLFSAYSRSSNPLWDK